MRPSSRLQTVGLVLLRTLIGWHFLYEGFYKLVVPGWSPAGAPLSDWSAAGYLRAASGPLAGLSHRLAESGAIAWIDTIVPIGLLLVGLSLILGCCTQAGCWGALGFLTLFYLTNIPTTGVPAPGNEGTYLLVNKNLIEWASVLVVLAFRTGSMAGLDRLWTRRWSALPVPREPASVASSNAVR